MSSTSETVSALSMTVPASPSLYEVAPAEVVTTGASLAGAKPVMSRVATFDRLFDAAPSFTRNDTVRVAVEGVSELFSYATERSAAW